jgi:hypothetical protein
MVTGSDEFKGWCTPPPGVSSVAELTRRDAMHHSEHGSFDARRQVESGEAMPHVQFDRVVADGERTRGGLAGFTVRIARVSHQCFPVFS